MKRAFLSHFTPSLMKAEDLEAIFVQREDLAQRLVSQIKESALTKTKHHNLLIGPRGIGKTHLVSLVYYRTQEIDKLQDRLVVAWLREEEWGVASFLDFLLRIFRALVENYQDARLGKDVEKLFDLSPEEAEARAIRLLVDWVGDKTLLILSENLDDLFAGLEENGQQKFRALIQQHPIFCIVATSQSLFNDVSLQTSPFYGFFRFTHLQHLSLDEAVELLTRIAKRSEDQELTDFIQQPIGRARIRAVQHLSGGNHRVYVIFSQFLTRESLDDLVEPLLKALDELTPYYQARMTFLSPQQRKIVEYLCEIRHAVPVKEIAQRCFMTSQTASSQLKILREFGYVISHAVGRESFYELQEPLMRLSIEVKKHRGEPVRLLVDFLRYWHSREELEIRLDGLNPEAKLERVYIQKALEISENEEDPRIVACLKDYETYIENKNFNEALNAVEDLIAIRGTAFDWMEKARCHGYRNQIPQAIQASEKALELSPNDHRTLHNRGVLFFELNLFDQALEACEKAILADQEIYQTWSGKGTILNALGRYNEALFAHEKAISLKEDVDTVWSNMASTLIQLGRFKEALDCCEKAISFEPKSFLAWHIKGIVLEKFNQFEEALEAYKKATSHAPEKSSLWSNLGVILTRLNRLEEALKAHNKALSIAPTDSLHWMNKGITLRKIDKIDDSIDAFERARELDKNNYEALCQKGISLALKGISYEAMICYYQSLEEGFEHGFKGYLEFHQILFDQHNWKDVFSAVKRVFDHITLIEIKIPVLNVLLQKILFTESRISEWHDKASDIIDFCISKNILSILSQGLVGSVLALSSKETSITDALHWSDLWNRLGGKYQEMRFSLNIMDAAVKYRETKDEKVLLKLPVEERKILEEIIAESENIDAKSN